MVMKKILLLLSVFVLFACEQEDLNGLVDESRAEVGQQSAAGSRAASSIADFDPIAELEGIQVNILNMGTMPYKYLSCVEKGNQVDLYDKDDGSMRQRWYVGGNFIKLVGGNQTFEGKDAYIKRNGFNVEEPYPVLGTQGYPQEALSGNLTYINGDLVVVFPASFVFPSLGGSTEARYLQPEAKNSNNLQYKKGNNDMSTHWRLELVGDDYAFEKIQYVKAAGDYIGLQAPKYKEYEYNNMGKQEPGKAIFQFTETMKYESKFTESQAINISNKISQSTSIGTPTSVGGNISSETTTSYGWTFTTTKGQEETVSITDTYEYIVPADKYIKMKVYIASYTMSITYIMTIRRKHDGKLFRVKGKWEGVQGTKITYEAVDGYTGEILSQSARDVAGEL